MTTMTMKTTWLAIAASFLALAVPGSALLAGQARDAASRSPQTGTAFLSGLVVTDEAQSRPVRRATVTITAGLLGSPRSTVTDDAGRFAFTNLAAGSFSLVVNKAGFVAAYYGSRTQGRPPGVPIALLDGQRTTDITVRLLRGSVITGTVQRASGQPAVGVNVQAALLQMVNGERRLSLISGAAGAIGAQTDDRGEYRIYGLQPGEYLVTAGAAAMAFMANDARQVTAAELRWADQIAARGATVAPSAAATPPPPEPGQTVIYSTVYYPGTVEAAAATTIAIGPGEERSAVNFTTPLVPTARITGTVLDPAGNPMPNAQVQVQPKRSGGGLDDILASLMGRMNAPSGADGSFVVSSVTPGEYALTVRAAEAPPGGRQQRPSSPLDSLPMGLLGGGAMSLWASENVTVQGRDITGLTLRLQPGMTVSGRVVYESTTRPAPTDYSRTRLVLSTMPTGSGVAGLVGAMLSPTPLTVAADGTFTSKGVVPGQYRLTVFGAGMMLNQLIPGSGDGWTLKSAMLNGRDIADVPFEVRPGEAISGVVVTYSDRPTELTGSVLDRANRATGNFPIVVFSTEREYWTLGSRRVQLVRPSSDGKFKATGLPAGEYFVCAVTEVDEEQLYEPTFLELLVPGSFKITLAEGERKTQDLRLAGG